MLDRRTLIVAAAAMSAVSSIARSKAKIASPTFPTGFLWGASTAGTSDRGKQQQQRHMVSGDIKPTVFGEPSHNAANSFHL
jgi:beta-glucosidase